MTDHKRSLLAPFVTYSQQICLALIHKISHDLPLTKDEAYYLTRSVPTKEPVYTQIKEAYVYPYLSEAEIYLRDLVEGDMDTLEDIINDIRERRKSKHL